VGLAFSLSDRVLQWAQRARAFFYAVVLWDHACPSCGGDLTMVKEGQCRCKRCGTIFDPTPVFQRCSACGGQSVLRIRRYQCRQCGADVPSRFLFDGLVFDAEYFRQKMAESRQRKQDLRERVREMLANSRSLPLGPMGAGLDSAPGLAQALDAMVGAVELPAFTVDLGGRGFDLARYESHVQAHLGAFPVRFDDVPPLDEDPRRDRIRRFIAILFLAQAGAIELWQEGPTILVMQRDPDAERCPVPGEVEAVA
jgi:hypothetical protein